MTGIHSALTASIPDLRSEVTTSSHSSSSFLQPTLPLKLQLPSANQILQGQEREEEGGSEDIVTEVDNVLGKLMASLQKGNTHNQTQRHTRKHTNHTQTHTHTHTMWAICWANRWPCCKKVTACVLVRFPNPINIVDSTN